MIFDKELDKRYEEDKWVSSLHKVFAKVKPEIKLEPKKTALFIVDMQKGSCLPECALQQALKEREPEAFHYWMERLKSILPNLQRLQGFFREAGLEVVQCRGRSLTPDGRDKRGGHPFSHRPPGSEGGEVLDELKPLPHELLLTKQRGSMFLGYDTYYVLQNMGIEYLVFGGMVTDGCVTATITNAKDLFGGDRIVIVEDCCGAFSEEGHVSAIRRMGGSSWIASTESVLKHLTKQLQRGVVSVGLGKGGLHA